VTALTSFSVSSTGTLVYRSAGVETQELLWLDRAGVVVGAIREPGIYLSMALSRDGAKLLVGQPGQGAERYVWLFDLQSDAARQLTFRSDLAGTMAFSPDGSRTMLALYDGARLGMWEKDLRSGAEPRPWSIQALNVMPTDWPQDDLLIVQSIGLVGRGDWDLGTFDLRTQRFVESLAAIRSVEVNWGKESAHINTWHGVDGWDDKLVEASEATGGWISLIFYLARAGVWISRAVLWILMTIGDIISTGLVESVANNVDDIIAEIAAARVTERGSRADDKAGEAAMEDRKKAGYF